MIPKSGCFFSKKWSICMFFYLTRVSNFHDFSIKITKNHVFFHFVYKNFCFSTFCGKIHVSGNPGHQVSRLLQYVTFLTALLVLVHRLPSLPINRMTQHIPTLLLSLAIEPTTHHQNVHVRETTRRLLLPSTGDAGGDLEPHLVRPSFLTNSHIINQKECDMYLCPIWERPVGCWCRCPECCCSCLPCCCCG